MFAAALKRGVRLKILQTADTAKAKAHAWVSFWKSEIHPLLSLKDFMEQLFLNFLIY